MGSNGDRRAVLMVCDGLRADMITKEHSPTLARLTSEWFHCSRHSSVFPSTTRVTSASIATGCLPGTHGLAGNVMAIRENGRLKALNAGAPDFRDRLRESTGRTLLTPTLAQRLADHGGSIVFSNVSPGAAYFQDPDGFGYVYQSSQSYGPGLKPLPEAEGLPIKKGVAGDQWMTERFCREVLRERRPALSVIWLSEPDHTGHDAPLGGPEHLAAIRGADQRVAEVLETLERDDPHWERTLFLVCSDHGHETVSATVPMEKLLVDEGLKDALDSDEVVVASNGTSALIYLDQSVRDRESALKDWIAAQEWAGRVYDRSELPGLGHGPEGDLALAVDMAKQDGNNEYGVPGLSWIAQDFHSTKDYLGHGQHGGLGLNEQNPFLVIRGGDFPLAICTEAPTSPIQIAPTILRHLGLSHEGMDGQPIR